MKCKYEKEDFAGIMIMLWLILMSSCASCARSGKSGIYDIEKKLDKCLEQQVNRSRNDP